MSSNHSSDSDSSDVLILTDANGSALGSKERPINLEANSNHKTPCSKAKRVAKSLRQDGTNRRKRKKPTLDDDDEGGGGAGDDEVVVEDGIIGMKIRSPTNKV